MHLLRGEDATGCKLRSKESNDSRKPCFPRDTRAKPKGLHDARHRKELGALPSHSAEPERPYSWTICSENRLSLSSRNRLSSNSTSNINFAHDSAGVSG